MKKSVVQECTGKTFKWKLKPRHLEDVNVTEHGGSSHPVCGITCMDHLKAIYIWAFRHLEKEKAYILHNKRTTSRVTIQKSICSWFLHPYNIHNHLVCTSIHNSRPTATRERPSSYLQREREAGAVQWAKSTKQMKHTNIQTPSHKPGLFELRVQRF